VRGQLDAVLVGRVDLHVEPHADAGQPAADPGGAPRDQSDPVEVLDVEVDRRPEPDRVRVGEHLEHLLGARVCLSARRPFGHSDEIATAQSPAHRPGRGSRVILSDDAGAPPRRYFDAVSRLRSMHARIRAMDPFRADIALAAAFVVAAVIEVFTVPSRGDNMAVTVVAGVVAQAGLAWRRRNPLLAAAVFAVPTTLQALAEGFLTQDTTVQFLAAMLLLYSIGRYAAGRTFWIAFPVVMAGSGTAMMIEDGLERSEYFFWLICLFSLPLLVGRSLRNRARIQSELREKTELIERHRADRARSAVEDERERIASELQAVVANSVSAMVVQAETVPRVLAAGEPERAERAFAAIEETGRDALVEMRRLLGVLRRDGDRPELAPQPGLGRLDALVQRARDRGLDVTVREQGDTRPLSPGIDLTAYRIVQDALEAAAEKGASKAQVLVRFGERDLVLGVRDDREGGASDRLAGLRDRAKLYGGYLDAAPSGEWFSLRASIPIEHEAPAPAPTGSGS
jgi:signal transduction histidine kinase